MANTISVEICLDDFDIDELVEFVVKEAEGEVRHELKKVDKSKPLHIEIQEKRAELKLLEDRMMDIYLLHNLHKAEAWRA